MVSLHAGESMRIGHALGALAGLWGTGLIGTSAALAEEEIFVDPVLVFGPSRAARDLFETPNSVSVIGEQEILRLMPQTYEDLMGDIPGVSIPGGPRGISHEPNIRGFQDEQVVLRVDGARYNFNAGHRGRFFTDPEILKRIEVIRGGASTAFGSGALGGVVLLDTKDAEDIVKPGDVWGGRIKLGYNSQGAELRTAATLAAKAEEFDILGFVSYSAMGDDMTDGGGQDILNSELDVFNSLFKIGYEPTEGQRFELSYQFYDDTGVTPPNANAGATPDTVVDRAMQFHTAQLAWDYAPAGSDLVNLSALVYFNQAKLEEDRIADGRFDETTYTTFGAELVNRSDFDFGLPVRLTYGVEAYRDEQEALRNGAPRLQAPDATALFAAAFVQADVELSPEFTLTPGVRLDYYSLDPEGAYQDRSEAEVSPRLALTWRPQKATQIWASAGQSFRAPSLTELYNDGVHFSTTGFGLGPGTVFSGNNVFVPTPDLEPEKALQFELGARHDMFDVLGAGDKLSFSGSAYYGRVDDYIDQVVTFIDFSTATFNPITGNLEVDGTTMARNVDAVIWGFEGEVAYDSDLWFASAALTLPRGRAQDGGGLGSIPADRIVLTLGLRPDPDLELGVRANLVDGQDDVPTGSTPTPGYTTFDLFVNWVPQDGPFADLEFAAGIDNVLDREFRIHPNGLNQPGRAYKVSAAWNF